MDGFSFANNRRPAIGIKAKQSSNHTLEAQLARSPDTYRDAFRIRYDAYRSYGYIPERADQQFSDIYDTRPNCATILVHKRGETAATVRVSIFDPNGPASQQLPLQAMEIFDAEIRETMAALRLKIRQPRVMEIAKLARRPEFAKDLDVVFALYRAAGYLILHHDVDIVFNAVRAHHLPMYRRFGFQPLTSPKSYPGLGFQTALMACFRTNYDAARDNLPFLRGIATTDDAYARLIAGERVPIFATNRPTAAPQSLTPARLAG